LNQFLQLDELGYKNQQVFSVSMLITRFISKKLDKVLLH